MFTNIYCVIFLSILTNFALAQKLCSTNNYPFMLTITLRKYTEATIPGLRTFSACGGSLIKPTWALTAASCVQDVYDKNVTPSNYIIKVAVHRKNPITITLKRYLVHPTYDKDFKKLEYFGNNIALLELSESLVDRPGVKFVTLPKRDDTRDPFCSTGLLMMFKSESVLHCQTSTILSTTKCKEFLKKMIQPKQTCTLEKVKGRSSKEFEFDTGGPLLCGDVQVGIILQKPEVAQGVIYTLNTDVREYLDFIKEYTAIKGEVEGVEKEEVELRSVNSTHFHLNHFVKYIAILVLWFIM